MKFPISIAANLFAVVLLISLLAAPIYFAKNISQVAGVKSQTRYLVASYVDNFPKMKLEQEGNDFKIFFEKQSESQAYLEVLALTNPTQGAQTYKITQQTDGSQAFFGSDWRNPAVKVTVPAHESVPISFISSGSGQEDSVQFSII